MKKSVLISALAVLFLAGALSVSAETITRTLSSGSGYTGYSPLGGQTSQPMPPPPQQGSNMQPERPPLYKDMGNKSDCVPPPPSMQGLNSYAYNGNERPAPPSFSGDRPDMPPNMGQTFHRPYQTNYNNNNNINYCK
jgi:hypothetical protein